MTKFARYFQQNWMFLFAHRVVTKHLNHPEGENYQSYLDIEVKLYHLSLMLLTKFDQSNQLIKLS